MMTKKKLTPHLALEKAIVLAQKSSWKSFSLTELASLLNCSLSEIKQFYRSKDDMAEALFDRADDAMLNFASAKEHQNLASDDKLIECIMVWFEALTPYKPMVREILTYKLEPGHFHLQAHGVTRISRTVQWFIAASDRKSTGLKRITDEVAITSAYLSSFSFFLFDHSKQHVNTRRLIKRLLRKINQCQRPFFSSASSKPAPINRKKAPKSL